MNNDFSQPQRQSLVGVVIMFGNTFQKTVRALWPILIIWVLKINEFNKAYLGLGALAVFILVAVIAYFRYLNFTFQLDEENEEFVIKEGIFNKSRLAIPLDKIQQVNINQSLLQRIIGVHALEVDTAGTGKKEVSIKAISHDLATSLKERLLDGSRDSKSVAIEDTDFYIAPQDSTKGHPFIKISLLSLIKTGLTSNYVRTFALLLAFVITTFQHIDEYGNLVGFNSGSLDNYITGAVMLKFLAFIVIGVMALILVINLVRTIFKYFGYKITKQRDSLLLSYGLINTKSTILRPDKVQIVTVTRNYFQKKLDIQDLKIRQASNKEANNQDQKKTAIEIPGCNNSEKDILLEFLLGEVPVRGVMLKPNIRKMLVPTVMFLIIPLSAYFWVGNTVGPEVYNFILFVPVYVLLVGIMIYFAFRHSRLFVNNDFIIRQSGAWDIDNDFIAPHRIQTISVTQYFWQKGSDIGIVSLHTAGGTISFGLANYTRLKQFVNYWLYQVETGKKNWM
ncbi:PH domain-containing protein [Flavobacterium sp. DGU11]|uniref:PH domain-containing protein n=1 Tax=Flavobacterium arundinis TaxID=3139143 RepID=A0ABU9HW10_9FLAO